MTFTRNVQLEVVSELKSRALQILEDLRVSFWRGSAIGKFREGSVGDKGLGGVRDGKRTCTWSSWSACF